MAVFLPTAIAGNGRTLATFGRAGEIMALFHPRLDFAQNIQQALPALYIGDPGHGVFHWTFGPEFRARQGYVAQTNILRTTLHLATPPLEMTLEDFCPPKHTALVRIVTIQNLGVGPVVGAFMHYFALTAGEMPRKQAVRLDPVRGIALQHFRDTAIAVGGTRPEVWTCGKAWEGSERSAKADMYDGHLNGQLEELGEVDFALGWRLRVRAGERQRIVIIISAQQDGKRGAEALYDLLGTGADALREQTSQADAAFVTRKRPVELPKRLQGAYERAILATACLADLSTGAVIAAPEFDPGYTRSGGYGYCWPRDATEAARGLCAVGYPEFLERLAGWYIRTQLDDGLWGQRYWSDGQIAPSWSLREDVPQIDQSAAALLALCLQAHATPAGNESLWGAILRAGETLARWVGPDGWHVPACDLWERYCGCFAYSNAAICAALREASVVAAARGFAEQAERWGRSALAARQATLASFSGGYFPRGRSSHGDPDPLVDSSTLGLVAPYALLSPDDPSDRRLIEANVATIERKLGRDLGAGRGIARYEGDDYIGGAIGCVNTLWMALVLLKLSRSHQAKDAARAADLRARALSYIEFALDHTTPAGLLPEMIGLTPETPYWAAPHAWAGGLLLQCVAEMA